MENFHQLPNLDDYLLDIKSYLNPDIGSIERNEFLAYIQDIPDAKCQFSQLVFEFPKWLELAEVIPPQFLIEKAKVDHDKLLPNKLELRIFSFETQPVIKVTVYVKK